MRADELPTYAVRFDGPKVGILPSDGAASGLDGALVGSVRGAALASGVVAGDLICRVNDINVLFKPFAFVTDVLRTAHWPCTIEFIPSVYGADLYRRYGVPLPVSTPRNDPVMDRLVAIMRPNDSYDELTRRIQEISRRMRAIGTADVTHPDPLVQRDLREEYFVLEQDMEACHDAIQHKPEYAIELTRLQEAWDDADADDALRALCAIRRMLPVNIKSLSETALTQMLTPNGQTIPRDVARKFKRTNILELLRTDPADVAKAHPAILENLRTTGLTLTERRALHAHLRDVGRQWARSIDNELGKRRYDWFQLLRGEYVASVNTYKAHVAQFGLPGSHPYATPKTPDVGCPLRGKQCPLMADASPAYSSDYGYPDGPVYMGFEGHNDYGIGNAT
ncbi:hypothetical protein SDRG_16122 [Saprolegnia diclina VS20]|uniref:PDZ domain-containing protein n=1 Tax=Saprolegnia diclina (strain VS20) TaxID=1156394 RepID=T0PY92_SAPDV|nr:hypothetical protein SDRG_16122 [Saprolegnia diclina VS20]EQC26020.1 hypothetical protein SDRG_16122 [Saprolegnia diclina VS20]|eukprot:XP_008620541.1 hypothetical protein SDRG_16122 [Saprolegnia diclina VS20]